MIYRLIATHLAHKAATGAVTRVQRLGSALNLSIHLHMLCLDGVHAPRPDGGLRFTRVKALDPEALRRVQTARGDSCLALARSPGAESCPSWIEPRAP